MRLLIYRPQVGISDVAELFANSRLISTFYSTIDLPFWHVFASVFEAKFRLCVNLCSFKSP